ncbi:Rieske (2Fe-2S) protein [Geodermatophilus sp. YIM 151500]|uniref:Rieske (2Fe-2S) protein n=1 Tax=Geodermatophilus sp. YIM 151500 TaxID=2984531 RepID=UPI0021E4057C|nr:Rieske (2Fe-2S) protein [Geodermatophilus sp. YIM 151500]MCV2490537.1 Rieske (2Fe-2S) protein [Geodermatophilus sp. YIM 151500]
MTTSVRPPAVRSAGWFPVARAAEVGTTPLPVGAGGQAFVVVRLRPGGEVSAFPARCPHRLVPLSAGTVVDGRLRCRYHGWRFDAEGRCVAVPALGPDGVAPPRADLPVPWAVEERHGWVWLAPERTAVAVPPPPADEPRPEPAPPLPEPAGPVFGNLDPSLARAWHPVALSRELRPGGWSQVRLAGRTWALRRTEGGLVAEPPAFDVGERYGIVWLAPEAPAAKPLRVPELTDRRFVVAHLQPERAAGPAAPLLDTLLDETHADVPPSGDPPPVSPADGAVVDEPGGFTAVREPGPAESYRTTTVVRAPFQLRRRVEDPRTGAVSTLVVVLQPEDADSTRVYGCLFLSAGPGRPLPAPADVARAVAAQQAALRADVDLQAHLRSPGLPLLPRDELHLAPDRLGVALRRALAGFARRT